MAQYILNVLPHQLSWGNKILGKSLNVPKTAVWNIPQVIGYESGTLKKLT